MQGIAETVFWAGIALVLYAYVGYPLLVAVLARVRRVRRDSEEYRGSVSVILSVYNEEASIARRVAEFEALVGARGRTGEIIVVSDGSTDRTADNARGSGAVPVRVIALPQNRGKAAAISLAAQHATGDVLVMADVRQRWSADALQNLLRPFNDPAVGAASGELTVESEDGVMSGVGLYWRYETFLRRNEARLHSTVGVSGSISAVRRSLFKPIPAGTLLDDVYWPLEVVMQGARVVFVADAVAHDRLPHAPRDEFRRKVRTLSGNFQLVTLLPSALLPWRNPICIQFVSHKLLRLVVPWALIAVLVASALADGLFYRFALVAQIYLYVAGAIALFTTWFSKSPVASVSGSFMLLNAAAWLGFFMWASGRAASSWKKVKYAPPRDEPRTGLR